MPVVPNNRSLLRRRRGASALLNALADGVAVIGIGWWLTIRHVGFITLEYELLLLLLLGALGVVYDQFGIYRRFRGFTSKALALLQCWTLSFLILTLLGFLTKQGENYSRLLVAQLYVFGLGSHVVIHLGFYFWQRAWVNAQRDADPAIIIGQGDLANYLALKINENPWLDQTLIGKVTLNGQDEDGSIDFGGGAMPRLGSVAELARILEERAVRVAYIVTPLETFSVLETVYQTLLDNHIAIHWVPDIFSLRLVNHSVAEIAGLPVLTLSETPLTGTSSLVKALEDRLLAALILVLVSPVLLAIAVAVKLDSPGPVIFRQARTGWSGRPFRIWKFRSMVVHEPEDGVVRQATRGDPRVTRVGGFLRRTSLDELPQIFNVLRGEMSLVGPRPHALQHDEEYSERILDYFARHRIKPGITGLAQVRGYRGETREVNEMVKRVESDIEYINNWSLWLDLVILARTAFALAGRKAY